MKYCTVNVKSNLKAATYHQREKQQFHHQDHMLSHSNHKPGGFHQQQTICKDLKRKLNCTLDVFLNRMNIPIGKGTGFAESVTGCRRKSGLQNTCHVDLQETPQVRDHETKADRRESKFKFIQHSVRTEGLFPS